MSISYQTPAFFSDFACLGADCEDTCCRDWEVKLDRRHYESLSQAVLGDKENHEKFIQYVHLNDNSISGDHDYAFIRMSENGYCAMLDHQGLCSIHKKHGVEALGNVCTMFPRVISRSLTAIELSGALSCPEVVRKCINDDKPLKLKRFKPSELPRSKNYPIQRDLSSVEGDHYSSGFNTVRQVMMKIIANEKQEFETRLYVLANLAQKLSAFYHRGCASLPAEQFEEMLTRLTSDEITSRLDTVIKNYEVDSPIAMIVVHSVLSIKLQQAKNENISGLYRDILQTLNASDEDVAAALMKKLEDAKNKLDEKTRVYIERAMTRYLISCLYREWFVSMPDPFTYVQMLLVRMAILRALIYLHMDTKKGLSPAELEKRIVFIMYNFARSIDQNLEFLKVVFSALSEQTMMTFDFSPLFIRIFGTNQAK